MSNKILVENDEIDLINLVKAIWDGKLLIISIIFISTLIGAGSISINNNESKKLPKTFETTFALYSNEDSKFLKFTNVNYILSSRSFADYTIQSDKIFQKLLDRLSDIYLARSFLKNNNLFEKKFSKLSEFELEKVILNYARSFNLIKNNDSNYIIKFNWDNANEGIEILGEYLNFVLFGLKNDIFLNLDFILDKSKELEINKDLVRIDNLIEQRDIAEELGIETSNKYNPTTSFNIFPRGNFTVDSYYLRGYKTIDKEISLIRNRKYRELNLLSKEINSLKKDDNIDWVKYVFISSTEKKFPNNDRKILIISIILGLIIGVISALILHSFKFKRNKKK